jgi:hypothetical protein
MAVNYPVTGGVPGIDYLLVDGNVNIGKNKGSGQLLLTRSTVFAFRVKHSAVTMGAMHFGLVGALIAHFIEKQRAKSRTPPEHLQDSEIVSLGEDVAKKTNRGTLLAKVPLNAGLKIERTRLGFQFTSGNEVIVYQGFMKKNKITEYLALLGIDVR